MVTHDIINNIEIIFLRNAYTSGVKTLHICFPTTGKRVHTFSISKNDTKMICVDITITGFKKEINQIE